MRVVHGEILDYNIFGMQNQDECWCGVSIPEDGLKIEDSKCNSNKLGGLGDHTMAVYRAAWEPLKQSKHFVFPTIWKISAVISARGSCSIIILSKTVFFL